ncbi:hypothetical protein BJF79_02550 [Actinomadura sp. CNU-125]|uniref:enediyne antibiotic chromoprotein n=1 Tax=Actinomadura sp. CNU-125 TaxID=1904961 RepID=UPI00096009BD|nr:enediyne antibiotic chromoprotein [Actinomadura sp. CNU-125]OLT19155.1 hypothetical protein BJF79_02550 [Actinomadura sp. CNU-125]
MAGVTAVLGGGLIMGAQTASAAAQTATVTPSSGLSDGATVQVAAAGFDAGDVLTAGQCATVGSKIACNPANQTEFTADAGGSASTTMVLNRTFVGAYVDGSGSAGTVDCGTASCFIGVGDFAGQGAAPVPISFS